MSADKSCTCASEFQIKNNVENSKLSANYQFQSKAYLKIDNDAEFLEGTNKEEVVVLIHGFIASPFEVRAIARQLNDHGYSVYMPLLYGFGANGETANKGKLHIWRKQIKTVVQELSRCFKKVTLGGMSLGAALATDYYLTTKDKNISSLVLMSPYFDISQSVAKLLVGPLSTIKESVSLSMLYALSRSDDLVEILKNSRYYSDIMPFKTLQELFQLSDDLKAKKTFNKLDIPVFVAYSEFDTTIDLAQAKSLPKEHFKNVNEFVLKEELNVPHQIAFESSNPKFKEMATKIRKFIWFSNLKHQIKY